MKNLTLAMLAFLFILMGCKEEVTEKPIEQEKKEVQDETKTQTFSYEELVEFTEKTIEKFDKNQNLKYRTQNGVSFSTIWGLPDYKNVVVLTTSRGEFVMVLPLRKREGNEVTELLVTWKTKEFHSRIIHKGRIMTDKTFTNTPISENFPYFFSYFSKEHQATTRTEIKPISSENQCFKATSCFDCVESILCLKEVLCGTGGGFNPPKINDDNIGSPGTSPYDTSSDKDNPSNSSGAGSSGGETTDPTCIDGKTNFGGTSYAPINDNPNCGSSGVCFAGINCTEYYNFKTKYNLTTDETQWYFTSSNSDFRAGIQSFEADYANAKVAVRAVIQLGHKNLLKGPYTDAQLQQIEEILPPITCAGCGKTQQTIEEFAYLIAKWEKDHPNQTLSKPKKIYLLAKAIWNVNRGVVHTALDICGVVPGAGEFCDGTNGFLYMIEGDFVNAGFSFGAMIPVAGWASTGAKYCGIAIAITPDVYKTLKIVKDKATGLLKFSHNSSTQFRKILNMTGDAWKNYQAHHIIPKEFKNHPVIQKAAQARDFTFHMNHPKNGKPIHTDFHNGSHDNYNKSIEKVLNHIKNTKPNLEPEEAAVLVESMQKHLEKAIKKQITDSPNPVKVNKLVIDWSDFLK